LEDRAAQRGLDDRRGVMGHHGAPVFEPAPQQDGQGGQRSRQDERRQRVTRDDPGQEPAEERQASDAHAHREQTNQDGPRDAPPHPASEFPESTIEVHGRSLLSSQNRCRVIARNVPSIAQRSLADYSKATPPERSPLESTAIAGSMAPLLKRCREARIGSSVA